VSGQRQWQQPRTEQATKQVGICVKNNNNENKNEMKSKKRKAGKAGKAGKTSQGRLSDWQKGRLAYLAYG